MTLSSTYDVKEFTISVPEGNDDVACLPLVQLEHFQPIINQESTFDLIG
jgi:hypothetical protein